MLHGYTPPGSSWPLAQGILRPGRPADPAARTGPAIAASRSATSRPPARRTQGANHIAPSCAHALARFHGFVTYQPAGRYWAFQGIEAGIFLLLAAILLTVTAVVLLRRDA